MNFALELGTLACLLDIRVEVFSRELTTMGHTEAVASRVPRE